MSNEKVKVAYIGRKRNIHDAILIEALVHKFDIKEFYTVDFPFEVIPVREFYGISLIIAGPLTDTFSLIPQTLDVPILGISHAFDLNIESETYPIQENIDRCAGIICDCQHSAKVLESQFNFRGKLFEVPFGCDREFFSRVNIDYTDKLNILVTRNWFKIYRNDLILEALTSLKDMNLGINCTFLGEGPLFHKEAEKYIESNDSHRLHFKGKKDKSEVREEMSHNWLYISAASSDGSSISLLEAMAAGMICIVSDFPSNLEWVENHFNGFTFKNGDASDLARTIQVVAKLEVEKKTSIGKRAQEIISARGDWETNRLKFIAAVTELSR